jgi:RNA polymerase sigma factor (sigma-70 family)
MKNTGEILQDEARLVARARQADEAAWIAIVRTYQEPVFRMAYLILGERHEAEDAAQETLIRAYRSLDRFDPQRPLKPWLLSIAANTAKNRRRAGWRYTQAIKRLFRLEAGVAADPYEGSNQAVDSLNLWQAVQSLPLNDQQIIYLRYFMELSVAETAGALDIAPGTVKSRLNRALVRLKEKIEVDFPELMDNES